MKLSDHMKEKQELTVRTDRKKLFSTNYTKYDGLYPCKIIKNIKIQSASEVSIRSRIFVN